MANETFIKGNQVVFSIWDTDAYEPMACITSSSISESLEIDEIETKCDPGNIVKTPGSYSYEITSDGIYIDESVDTGLQSHGKLKALLRAKTKITWKMATGITSPTAEYGYGYITALDLTGEAGSNATFSITISGTGAIVSVDPNA
tara:strand:+ start:33071 stop:33508 length:438 start_codon:yes stop_codon:yes gene_type:complete